VVNSGSDHYHSDSDYASLLGSAFWLVSSAKFFKKNGGEEVERIPLVELYQQRQKERREKGQSDKRFRINPDGDIYLILTYYSEERGISARNISTGKIQEFPGSLFVIPEEE